MRPSDSVQQEVSPIPPIQSGDDLELTNINDSGPSSGNLANNEPSWAFPEGGLGGWMCLLGSFLMMFPSFGFQTAGK